jgi:hypothetical protein
MLVLVKCVIFDGRTTLATVGDTTPRITHVREGQVLGAWRAVDGRIGFALLNLTAMTMVPTLLEEAFPNSRHIDVDEVVAVDAVSSSFQQMLSTDSGKSRQTGT